MTIEALYDHFCLHPKVETDTRKLEPGDLFFALKGPNFNGNSFASAAIEKGASLAVIDEEEFEIAGKTVVVDDVLKALQALALHHRLTLNIPFLAITGTNGKTTTKELIHSVLSTTFKTYTTEGNLNNQIGIPLTLLKIKKDAQLAVIEMGANHQREIASYCEYARPTHGLITNTGKAHLEGFGGIEGVRKGKGELFDYLRETKGTAFIMNDYNYLREMSTGIPHIITYGTSNADVTGVVVHSDPFLEIELTGETGLRQIRTQLVGNYNLPNVLAAVTVGRYFGVDANAIVKGIEAYTPSNSRSQMANLGSNKIILDAYNANPSSMSLAIQNFASLANDRKILVLGSMAELGSESAAEHQALIELIGRYSWEKVVLVGKGFGEIPNAYLNFETSLEARNWFKSAGIEDSFILVKGSRSMRMERVIED